MVLSPSGVIRPLGTPRVYHNYKADYNQCPAFSLVSVGARSLIGRI